MRWTMCCWMYRWKGRVGNGPCSISVVEEAQNPQYVGVGGETERLDVWDVGEAQGYSGVVKSILALAFRGRVMVMSVRTWMSIPGRTCKRWWERSGRAGRRSSRGSSMQHERRKGNTLANERGVTTSGRRKETGSHRAAERSPPLKQKAIMDSWVGWG